MNKSFARHFGFLFLISILGVSSAHAGVRYFYWTSESQSYAYDYYQGQRECYAQAEDEAFPYAYNTCVQKIGPYSCENGTTSTQYLEFGGQPGLYHCKVRVWVQAYQ